jgi:hypothetical protein
VIVLLRAEPVLPACLKRLCVLSFVSRRTLNFFGVGMEYAPFIILYGLAFEWCYRTSGQPYAAAIAHEAAKKAAK